MLVVGEKIDRLFAQNAFRLGLSAGVDCLHQLKYGAQVAILLALVLPLFGEFDFFRVRTCG